MANVEGLSCSKPVKNYIDSLVTLNKENPVYCGIVVVEEPETETTMVFLASSGLVSQLNFNEEELKKLVKENNNITSFPLCLDTPLTTILDTCYGLFSIGEIYDDPKGELAKRKHSCSVGEKQFRKLPDFSGIMSAFRAGNNG